jgi:hypothetical protein
VDLNRTDSSNNDLVGQGVTPVATSATATNEAMVTVCLDLSPAHALMGSDKRGPKAETHRYTEFIIS